MPGVFIAGCGFVGLATARLFAERGWEVMFLGTGTWGAAKELEFPPHPRISVRLLPFVEAGWRQKAHYVTYMMWVLWVILRWRPRWVYASDVWTTPIALLLTFLPGLRILYHEHDAPGPASGIFTRWVLTARKRLARRANGIVIPNQQRAEMFRQETETTRPIYVVWNCPDTKEVGPKRSDASTLPLRVLFHGSIVPERLPGGLIEALAALPKAELHVVGYETVGSKGYIETLQTKARQLGVDTRFIFHGAQPTRADLLAIVRYCDVGLALMPTVLHADSNLQMMTGASNKPFDYLSNGVALVVSNLPDWCDMFVATGYGKACQPDNVTSIVEALRWYIEHPDEMRRMGEQGRQKVMQEWNYETQFHPLLTIL